MPRVYHEKLQRLGSAERLGKVCVYDAKYTVGNLVSVFLLSCTGRCLKQGCS